VICVRTSRNGVHTLSHARVSRPAEALLPNSPSCGNQPANISLTAPSRTDTHANLSTRSGPAKRRPRSHRGAASPCPLDNTPLHISRRLGAVPIRTTRTVGPQASARAEGTRIRGARLLVPLSRLPANERYEAGLGAIPCGRHMCPPTPVMGAPRRHSHDSSAVTCAIGRSTYGAYRVWHGRSEVIGYENL
jgi:hypothetical protein